MEKQNFYICFEEHTENNPLLLLCQCKTIPVCKQCLIKQAKTHCTVCKEEYSDISKILGNQKFSINLWGETKDDLLQSLNFCGKFLNYPNYKIGYSNNDNMLIMHDPIHNFLPHKITERKGGRIFMLDLFFVKVCGGNVTELRHSVAGILKLTKTNWSNIITQEATSCVIVETHDDTTRKYKYSKPSKGFYSTFIKI